MNTQPSPQFTAFSSADSAEGTRERGLVQPSGTASGFGELLWWAGRPGEGGQEAVSAFPRGPSPYSGERNVKKSIPKGQMLSLRDLPI